MNSELMKLNGKDVAKGVLIAVFSSVLLAFHAMLTGPDFSFSSIDFGDIAKVALTSGISYVLKNLLSDDDGKFLGAL